MSENCTEEGGGGRKGWRSLEEKKEGVGGGGDKGGAKKGKGGRRWGEDAFRVEKNKGEKTEGGLKEEKEQQKRVMEAAPTVFLLHLLSPFLFFLPHTSLPLLLPPRLTPALTLALSQLLHPPLL